ncbi:MAG: ATP-binding cassette domain-containing protein [Candidatus Latescibacterota bacterium]|nr:MAG: ATP-binding cassette domain-containing protein [Candidatus Latescibacterota bacterium]
MTAALLEVNDAEWGYSTGSGLFFPAKRVSFHVRPREIVLLTGPNGAGKTTILRGLLGLVRQGSGTIRWSLPRSLVSYVPQESAIDRSIPATALDVVRTGNPTDWGRGVGPARKALAHLGIESLATQHYAWLSGGQRQRVLFARAMVGSPKLLLLDEPTINVDAATADRIGELLTRLCTQDELGMVITSHVKDWVAATREVKVEVR